MPEELQILAEMLKKSFCVLTHCSFSTFIVKLSFSNIFLNHDYLTLLLITKADEWKLYYLYHLVKIR